MPTIERTDQAENQTMDENTSPSSEESNSGNAETKQIKQPRKVAVKKKTAKKAVRKKAAKTAGGRTSTAKKKTAQASRKVVQDEESNDIKAETKQIEQPRKVAAKKKTARKKVAKKKAVGRTVSTKKRAAQTSRKVAQAAPLSGSDPGASVTGNSEAKIVRPAEQKPPEKPVAGSASAVAAPPHTQPLPQGGTGLRGFWIKVGTSAIVILAGLISIYSFFSEDEAASRPEATQAAAGAQGDDASNAGRTAADTGSDRGVVIPPATEQSNVAYPESLHGHSNEPGTFAAGAAVSNEPVVETPMTTGVVRGATPAADQAHVSQRDAAASTPYSSRFSEESTGYRPELYRPLEPKQDPPPPPTQASTVSEAPRDSVAPAPSYYPQPGTYPYPPAPYYGGYGRYYPY